MFVFGSFCLSRQLLFLLEFVDFGLPLIQSNSLLLVERLEVLQRLRPIPNRDSSSPSFDAGKGMILLLCQGVQI